MSVTTSAGVPAADSRFQWRPSARSPQAVLGHRDVGVPVSGQVEDAARLVHRASEAHALPGRSVDREPDRRAVEVLAVQPAAREEPTRTAREREHGRVENVARRAPIPTPVGTGDERLPTAEQLPRGSAVDRAPDRGLTIRSVTDGVQVAAIGDEIGEAIDVRGKRAALGPGRPIRRREHDVLARALGIATRADDDDLGVGRGRLERAIGGQRTRARSARSRRHRIPVTRWVPGRWPPSPTSARARRPRPPATSSPRCHPGPADRLRVEVAVPVDRLDPHRVGKLAPARPPLRHLHRPIRRYGRGLPLAIGRSDDDVDVRPAPVDEVVVRPERRS